MKSQNYPLICVNYHDLIATGMMIRIGGIPSYSRMINLVNYSNLLS